MSTHNKIIGVDLGGTKILAGRIANQTIEKEFKLPTPAKEAEDTVINALIQCIEEVMDKEVTGIGIGVPGLVDVEKGIVSNVFAIPSWKEVHLKEKLEAHFKLPVYVNNDANCFALGEKYFGKGKNFKNLVALTIGTGLGSGIIANNKLYSGTNCAAGEFGAIPYKEGIIEDYCASYFFKNQYGTDGQAAFTKAQQNDPEAQKIFDDLGEHIAFTVQMIMFSVDPDAIILGGSVSESFPLFKKSMWEHLQSFPFKNSLKKIVIEKSELKNPALSGAAALVLDSEI